MLYIYTGDGKGKTTAAIGSLMRAYGAGKSCAIVFFDKNSDYCNELAALRELGIPSHIFGLNRVYEGYFRSENSEGDFLEAGKALDKAYELISDGIEMLVLDEFLNVLRLNQVPLEEGLKLIDSFPKEKHLFLTGRGLPDEVADRADLVSEINKIKHPFEAGVKAERGIDF
jgi:cob(I)alamin adenosyltransferase